MKYEDVCKYAEENEVEITLLENPRYENSILGITTENKAVYSLEQMILDLMAKDKISYEEALEFIEYNTMGALASMPNAPIIMVTM